MRSLLVLILCTGFLLGCATLKAGGDFESADKLVKEKRYGEAIALYDKVAKGSSGTGRAARALYAGASARAAYDNPHRDLPSALQEFEEFIKRYPDHERVYDARNWRSLIRSVVELKKENERLNQNIEQLKRVDIRHEERRKGK